VFAIRDLKINHGRWATHKNKYTNAQPALSDTIAKKAIASLSSLVFYYLGVALKEMRMPLFAIRDLKLYMAVK